MSRIGKQIITIPEKTDVTQDGRVLTVKGPQGELTRTFKSSVAITVDGNEITCAPTNDTREAQALWGTYASHVNNMVQGVNTPFEKKLTIEGVGYRGEMKGTDLVLNVGYSHPVTITPPEGVTISVDKATVTISGVDKEAVGSTAADIRAVRKPEPYKGKGIRYEDEIVRRKEGKKSV